MKVFQNTPNRVRGITIVELIFVIAMIAIANVIAIPKFACTRGQAREATAIGNLRKIYTEQDMFYQRDADKDGISDYAKSLGELHKVGYIGPKLASGYLSGYRYNLTSKTSYDWECTAVPDPKTSCATRSFYVGTDGVVRESSSGPASSSSPPIQLGSGPLAWDPNSFVVDGTDLTRTLETLHDEFQGFNESGVSDTITEIANFLVQEESIQSLLRTADGDGDDRISLEELQSLDLAECLDEIRESLPTDLSDAEVDGEIGSLQSLLEDSVQRALDEIDIDSAVGVLEEVLSELEEQDIRDEFDEITDVDPLLNWRDLDLLEIPAESAFLEAAMDGVWQALLGESR